MTLLVAVQNAIDAFNHPVNEEALFRPIFDHPEVISRVGTRQLVQRYDWLASHRDEIQGRPNYYSLNAEKRDIENELADNRDVDIDSYLEHLKQEAELPHPENRWIG